ncbi:threonine synthase [Kordiimonas sp. SCSIO 12610]|uniref:threonine synthase n=1 Tax=Kordiimonas sp. SCSIO 12610 TaxID=2829597 RepID=UPI00210E675C|nr:threonine synthase [Kordiimonas sp. SCSIO 12610]UTW54906.1 threonine synthase [Kordiimonas sp. SCSIO 12610]
MKYISTRGKAEILDFKGVTLTGLARDGGLYIPETIPEFSEDKIRSLQGKSYPEVAFEVIKPFVGGCVADDDLKAMLHDTYGSSFRHDATAPMIQMGPNEWLLELFQGPTLAFKDFALQLLGRFFDYFTNGSDKKITILGATSGDTGSAAIEACRGRDNVRIFMLHPKGRVSDVQRRQMTTINEDNVTNIALDGTFDDCQALVKACFNDLEFRDAVNLTAVNSINWARVMAQIVYYFTSALSVGAPDRMVSFSVPTGNFGDIFAGYIAKKMGLPINRLIIATNSNDILVRALKTGAYHQNGVNATLSPSMDIQISSNFERLIFDLADRNPHQVASYMSELQSENGFTLSGDELARLHSSFDAFKVDDAATLETIRTVYERSGYILDPHSAIGLKAARECASLNAKPCITLATAHPAKFSSACEQAIGVTPELPGHMADLFERKEHYISLDNDKDMLQRLINVA